MTERALLVAAIALSTVGAVAAHDPVGTKVTWDREIAPILQTRCVSCHSDGGRAPMALATYEEARPWAKAIKEEVLTRRMPKWAAARGYGDFLNDRSLSPFEIALIGAWADGGAPKALPRTSPLRARPTAPRTFVAPQAREVSVPCDAAAFPPGRLLGVRPQLAPRASVHVVIETQAHGPEPLLRITAFDPEFPDTYWLRSPVDLQSGTHRNVTRPSKDCALSLFYGTSR